jgi:S-(hydroxymethyl)glutathione dehydrogenase/alcohol dehydrogenase
MRMRAAVLESFGEPLVVQELELDDAKGHEVLVRLVACGVCHTDLYTASGVDPPATRRRCSATRAPAWWRRSAPT